MVPRLPLPILLFLNPDASENQLGTGLYGAWPESCLYSLRDVGGVSLPVEGHFKTKMC